MDFSVICEGNVGFNRNRVLENLGFGNFRNSMERFTLKWRRGGV